MACALVLLPWFSCKMLRNVVGERWGRRAAQVSAAFATLRVRRPPYARHDRYLLYIHVLYPAVPCGTRGGAGALVARRTLRGYCSVQHLLPDVTRRPPR